MGTKKNKRVFSESFKRGKVRQIERGETTRSEVCRLYEVSSGLVHSWIEKYRSLPREERVVIETDSDYKKVLQLDKEKAELERCVGRQQVQLDYYEELLKLASEHFGVDIESVLKKKR